MKTQLQLQAERAAKIIETRGYDAFLRFVARNKAKHEAKLQREQLRSA